MNLIEAGSPNDKKTILSYPQSDILLTHSGGLLRLIRFSDNKIEAIDFGTKILDIALDLHFKALYVVLENDGLYEEDFESIRSKFEARTLNTLAIKTKKIAL